MADCVFKVSGEPRPKQSFRATRSGGKYTDKKVKDWQDLVSAVAREAMAGRPPYVGPMTVEIVFVRSTRHKVDIDNLSKAVLDGCNEIIWRDDRQVVKLILEKRVAKPPGCEVKVTCGG